MPGSIRLAQFGKTQISVHVTFLPVLIWAGWMGINQYGSLDGAVFHILAVVLLFVCVLLHEIGHTLYAHTCGIEVRYIVLLPVGGLASMEATTTRPVDELRIALAGPLVNLGLGVFFTSLLLGLTAATNRDLAVLAVEALRRPSVVGLLIFLAAANLLLAAFNLLPAFPLDGGRALRAILNRHMSFEAATLRAAIIGRSFGAGLLAIAIAMIALNMLAYGGALLLVAGLLYGYATNELRGVRRDILLQTWKVAQIIRPANQTTEPHESLAAIVPALLKMQVLPVMLGDQGRLVGLLTIQELRNLPPSTPPLSVAHVMRTHFPSVRPKDPLWVAYEKLQRANLVAIPVIQQDTFCGLVTLTDIRYVMREGKPPAAYNHSSFYSQEELCLIERNPDPKPKP